MNKKGFSAEVLCLFFIISTTILFGKILTDVKSIISVKMNQLIPQPVTNVEYVAHSYRIDETYDKLDEVNVIRNIEDLKKFKEKLVEEEISIDWLDKKLDNYNKEEFSNKTLVVLAVVNISQVTTTRVNSVGKKNNDLTISLSKTYKNKKENSKYTWLAVLELNDINSQILLNNY